MFSATIQRSGKMTKSIFAVPAVSDGEVRTVKIEGSGWSKPIAPPRDLKGIGSLTWLAYDPKNDVLYLMKMGSDLFKFVRGKSAAF